MPAPAAIRQGGRGQQDRRERDLHAAARLGRLVWRDAEVEFGNGIGDQVNARVPWITGDAADLAKNKPQHGPAAHTGQAAASTPCTDVSTGSSGTHANGVHPGILPSVPSSAAKVLPGREP
ncbi:hypothetical protein GCM10010324_67670 [Streptomyces hiroshimensis]|uniref:Uncharacterized protein n=1 Tax=Streptomyces hiroshimensis TaxID=66424 RepID=A0ABQ2ZBT3_9ACTN|nr:hypothetical protein GCM10010324_67670 [Streptomyces hiroshimensis]